MSALTDALEAFADAASYDNAVAYIRADCGLSPSQCGFNSDTADTDFDKLIQANIDSRAAYVTTALSGASFPLKWPLSDDNMAALFTQYEAQELIDQAAELMDIAVRSLVFFVEGDLNSLASAGQNNAYKDERDNLLGMLSQATQEIIPGKAQTTLSNGINILRSAAELTGWNPEKTHRSSRRS